MTSCLLKEIVSFSCSLVDFFFKGLLHLSNTFSVLTYNKGCLSKVVLYFLVESGCGINFVCIVTTATTVCLEIYIKSLLLLLQF